MRPSIEMNSLMKLRWMSYGSCWRRSCDEEWTRSSTQLFSGKQKQNHLLSHILISRKKLGREAILLFATKHQKFPHIGISCFAINRKLPFQAIACFRSKSDLTGCQLQGIIAVPRHDSHAHDPPGTWHVSHRDPDAIVQGTTAKPRHDAMPMVLHKHDMPHTEALMPSFTNGGIGHRRES